MFVWREIKRLRWRSLIIVILLAFSMAFISIIGNMAKGEMLTLKNINEKYSVADVTIYLNDSYGVGDIESSGITQEDWLEKIEYVLSIWGNAYVSGEKTRIALWGVKDRPKINTINAPEEVWHNFHGNVGVMDKNLAETLGLSANDIVSIFIGNKIVNVTILALVDMAWSISFTRPMTIYIAIPLEFAMNILELDSEEYNTILMDVKPGYDLENVTNRTLELLEAKNISVSTYTIVNIQALEEYVERFSLIFSLLMAPLSIIAAVFIIIIFMLKISNEARIIGVKRALGYTPRQIFVEIMVIGMALYILSLPVGFLLDVGMTYAVAGYVYSKYSGISKLIVIVIDLEVFFRSAIICLFATIIAIYLPARKASRMNISDVIRYGMEKPRAQYGKGRVYKRLFIGYAIRHLKSRKMRSMAIVLAFIIGFGMATAIINFMVSLNKEGMVAEKFYKADIMISFNKPRDRASIMENISRIQGVEDVEAIHFMYIEQKNFELNGRKNGELFDVSIPITVIFCEPKTDLIDPLLIRGGLPNNADEAFISYRLALVYDVDVNDIISIKDMDTGVVLRLKITGIGITQRSGGKTIIAMIDMAYRLDLLPNGTVKTLLIKTSNDVEPEYIAKKLIEYFGDEVAEVDILSYGTGIGEMVQSIQAFSISTLFVILIIVFSIYVVVSVISILERKYEISTLKSVGMTNNDVLKIIVLERTLLYLVAIAPIVMLSIILSQVLSEYFTLASSIEIYVFIDMYYLITTLMSPLIAIYLGLFPSYLMIRRISPSRVFRGVL